LLVISPRRYWSSRHSIPKNGAAEVGLRSSCSARISRVELFEMLPFLDRLASFRGATATAHPALRANWAVYGVSLVVLRLKSNRRTASLARREGPTRAHHAPAGPKQQQLRTLPMSHRCHLLHCLHRGSAGVYLTPDPVGLRASMSRPKDRFPRFQPWPRQLCHARLAVVRRAPARRQRRMQLRA
jgi:hypothetical protein